MSEKSGCAKWLTGCAIGCGALLLLGLVIVGGCAWWTKRAIDGFDAAVERHEELDRRLGDPSSYVPAPDGAVPPARMEAFLAVREAADPARQKLAAFFERIESTADRARELDEAPVMEKLRTAMGLVGGSLDMVTQMSEFFALRNEALLEHDMTLGEYSYIYTLAYHVWLGRPPDEGPGDDHENLEFDVGEGASGRVRDLLLDVLRNQRDALGPDEPPEGRARLEREIAAMEADESRLPWHDGLPEPIASSLEPYRERLEASYNATTNSMELAQAKKRGWGSFTLD